MDGQRPHHDSVAGIESLQSQIKTERTRTATFLRLVKKLRESETRFKLLYEQAPLGYQSLDEEGRFLQVNQAWLDLFGYSREEVLGRSFAEFMAPPERPLFEQRLARFKEVGAVHSVEIELLCKDGKSITVSIDGRIATDPHGRFIQTHCIVHDITAQKQSESILTVERDLVLVLAAADSIEQVIQPTLNAAVEVTGFACGGIYLLDHDSNSFRLSCHTGLSPQFCEAAEVYPWDSVQGQAMRTGHFIEFDDEVLAALPFSAVSEEGVESGVVVPVLREDQIIGSLIIGSRAAHRITNKVRQALEVIVAQMTVALARVQSEESLRRSQAELRAIYDHSPHMLCVLDGRRRLLYMNRSMAEFIGKSEDELRDQKACGIIGCVNALEDPRGCGYGRDCESCSLRQALNETLETGRSHRNVERQMTIAGRDGLREVVLLGSTSLIRSTAGVNLLLSLEDATERTAAAKKLELQALVLDQISDRVIVTDLDGHISYLNSSAARDFNCPREEVIGADVDIYDKARLHGESQRAIIEKTKREGQWHGEVVNRRDNDAEIALDCRTKLVLDDQGQPLAMCGIATDITDRKRSEQVLRESEKSFRKMFHQHAAVMLMVDSVTGAIRDANDAAAQFYGYSREQLRHMTIQQINVLPSEEVASRRAQAFANKCNYFVFPHRLSNGEVRTVEVHSTGISTRNERILLSIIHDITDRKRAEEALQDSERRLREIAANIPGAVYQFLQHPDGSYEVPFISDGAVALLERPMEILQDPERLFENVHPGDLHALWTSVQDSAASLAPWWQEFRIVCSDGRHRWIRGASKPRAMPDGAISWNGVLLDITDRKLTEETLREAMLRQETAIQAGEIGLWDWDLATNRVTYSAEWKRQIGYKEHEISDSFEEWRSRVHPDDIDDAFETTTRLSAAGAPNYAITFRFRHKDGSYRWILSRASVIKDESGKSVRVMGAHIDITQQMQLELQLRNSESLLSQSEAIAEMGSFVWDLSSDDLRSSTGMHRIWRLSESDFPTTLQNAIHGLIQPQDRQRVDEEARRMVAEQRTWPIEFRIRRADGEERLVYCETRPVFDSTNELVRIIGMIQDITRQRADETRLNAMLLQLNHTSRLAVMGELLAGIAHEINQPLCSIINFSKACANLADTEHVDLGQIRRWTEAINAAASRAGDIVRRLLGFARRHGSEPEPVKLKAIIDDAVLLVRHEASSCGIELRIDQPERDLTLHVQPGQIQQVLVNLLRNSIDAAKPEAVSDKAINLKVISAGDKVEISVSDCGIEIADEEFDRLFEPFFTTKPDGLGLGLAISRTIVEDHGGQVKAERNPGGGLTFHLALPIVRETISNV